MPVRNSSRPVLEVSMWPLNIRFLPPPVPLQRPTTLARASSTSCQVTSSPIFCSADCIYCPICSSSPVGLGMLITSVDMEIISSSRTSARMRSTSLGSRVDFEFAAALDTLVSSQFPVLSSQSLITLGQTEIIWICTHFFVTRFSDQKIVFQTQTSAAGPVNAGFDRQHHSLFYCACSGLVRIRPFVSAGANAMANGMRRLSGISAFGDAGAYELVEFREAGAVVRETNGTVEDLQQKIEQLVILRLQFAGAGILGEIGPIAVDADPDFEKRRLVFLNRTIAGSGERSDSLARPHQREGARHLDFTLVAHARSMDETFIHGSHFTFFHAGAHMLASVIHREGCEFVG